MKDLIEKLEKASGPSRELDALIECEQRKLEAYALGLNDKQRSHWKPIGDKGEVIDHQGLTRYHPLTYTFSIDAALTLVPEAWDRSLSGPQYRAATDNRDEFVANVREYQGLNPPRRDAEGTGRHSSPAIALCIAALRARSDGGEG